MAEQRPIRERETPSIVLRGAFNPAIFQPGWLAERGLLRPQEAENAQIQVIHPEVTAFTAGWLNLQVTRDQYIAISGDANAHELLRDFVSGTFRLFEHTPVWAAGFNHAFHYSMSWELNVRLGDVIVPTAPWSFLKNPLYNTLQVVAERDDGREGAVNVTLAPSQEVEGAQVIVVNDHFQLAAQEKPVSAVLVLDLITAAWDASHDRADGIATGLLANLDAKP